MFTEYIQKVEELTVLKKEVLGLNKIVRKSLQGELELRGLTEVCIEQRDSDKVLELKAVDCKAAFNMQFVQGVMQEFIDANGKIDTSNVGTFVMFADTERDKRKTSKMRLSYKKRPKIKVEPDAKRQKLVPAIPVIPVDADNFESQV